MIIVILDRARQARRRGQAAGSAGKEIAMSERQSDTYSADERRVGRGTTSPAPSPELEDVVPYPGLMLNRTRIGKGIERATVRLTGFSLQSYQVAKLRRQPYSPVALVTTVGR